ncbi:uncharacterized protein LOC141591452 isoform X2 [Silene latifolia]|uniref:uncharacterized protein LOC141591452 isoform X2 n=1 Tax=Silene latifolia TaxID=37657 RepID=UPI003D77D69B
MLKSQIKLMKVQKSLGVDQSLPQKYLSEIAQDGLCFIGIGTSKIGFHGLDTISHLSCALSKWLVKLTMGYETSTDQGEHCFSTSTNNANCQFKGVHFHCLTSTSLYPKDYSTITSFLYGCMARTVARQPKIPRTRHPIAQACRIPAATIGQPLPRAPLQLPLVQQCHKCRAYKIGFETEFLLWRWRYRTSSEGIPH